MGGVERAAEQTIAAAAAAVLWAGEDSEGVLAHVAGASAAKMAGDRELYAALAQGCGPAAAGEFIEGLQTAYCLEVAALPKEAAPHWFAGVAAAMGEACGERNVGYRVDARGRIVPHPDPAMRSAALNALARAQALLVCSLWGEDPLPLNMIEYGAGVVSNTVLTPRF